MLQTGQKAPDFTLLDKENKSISLRDFNGQKVVIYFYPKDDTPGCTKQACAFRNSYEGFKKRNTVVIGISKDSEKSHQKFALKYDLPFILLADKDGAVISAYDVKGAFGANRTTYIIDEDGMIEKVFEKASPDTNATDILEYLEEQSYDDTACSAEFSEGCK